MTAMKLQHNELTLGKEVGFMNPRTSTGLDAKSIADLGQSIEKDGLNDELHVWTTEHEGALFNVIVRGQRRWTAIGKLIESGSPRGKEFAEHGVPVKPVTFPSVLEAEMYAAREIAQSAGTSTFEQATYLAHLRERKNHEGKKISGKELAAGIGRSETWVSRIMGAFNAAGPELRKAWAAGMPDDAAKSIAAINDEKKQAEAVAEYLAAKASGDRKEVGKKRKEIAAKLEPERPPAKPKKKPSAASQALHRRSAAEIEEMLKTLEIIPSKHPALQGMRAFAEWVVGQRDDKQLPDEFHKELRKAMKEDAKRPRVGEKVSWKSQANGHWTAKTGKVIEVVDAMAVPKKFKGKKNGELPKRKHESYVVEANGQTYWPLVSQLKRIEAR